MPKSFFLYSISVSIAVEVRMTCHALLTQVLYRQLLCPLDIVTAPGINEKMIPFVDE